MADENNKLLAAAAIGDLDSVTHSIESLGADVDCKTAQHTLHTNTTSLSLYKLSYLSLQIVLLTPISLH